jgi:GMP synthase (glutamine-hydrolysing)
MTASPPKKAKTDASGELFKKHSVCLVLDYGSQYTQLIARRVRENGVLSMLLPGDVTMVSPAAIHRAMLNVLAGHAGAMGARAASPQFQTATPPPSAARRSASARPSPR